MARDATSPWSLQGWGFAQNQGMSVGGPVGGPFLSTMRYEPATSFGGDPTMFDGAGFTVSPMEGMGDPSTMSLSPALVGSGWPAYPSQDGRTAMDVPRTYFDTTPGMEETAGPHERPATMELLVRPPGDYGPFEKNQFIFVNTEDRTIYEEYVISSAATLPMVNHLMLTNPKFDFRSWIFAGLCVDAQSIATNISGHMGMRTDALPYMLTIVVEGAVQLPSIFGEEWSPGDELGFEFKRHPFTDRASMRYIFAGGRVMDSSITATGGVYPQPFYQLVPYRRTLTQQYQMETLGDDELPPRKIGFQVATAKGMGTAPRDLREAAAQISVYDGSIRYMDAYIRSTSIPDPRYPA